MFTNFSLLHQRTRLAKKYCFPWIGQKYFWHGRAKNSENIILFVWLFKISKKVICRSIHELKKGMTWKVCLIGRWRDYKRPDYFWTFYWFWASKLKSEAYSCRRYTYRVLQTSQMNHMHLCVRAERAVFGSAKTALKFKNEIWIS